MDDETPSGPAPRHSSEAPLAPGVPGPRVLHVHRIAGIGGSERHLLTLLPALRARGVRAAMLGLDVPGSAADDFYAALPAEVPRVRLPSPRDLDPVLAGRVVRAARSARPDLVHGHLVHGDVYGALAALATGAALVSTKHNDDPFRAGPFRHVERVLGRRTARVIAISDAVGAFAAARGGVPPERVRVVHYGMDAVPVAARPGAIDVPAGARVLLALGRLVEQKGHDVAIRAMPAVLRDHPEALLVIVGDGPLRPQLAALARELGVAHAVRLPGRSDDVAAWLARAELLVHPSRWEGFGLVLLEAMLAGRPVVASAVSAVPEVVEDGVTGVLVPPDDAAGLGAALAALLADPARARALGAAGLRRARAEHSVDRMAERTLAVYREALGVGP